MPNYKIQIAIDTMTGATAIGAAACRAIPAVQRRSEWVYGIQIGHRVAAFDGVRWWLMTPSAAKADPEIIRVERFPQ